MNDLVDVVVVGAGPVGLLMAIELALGGVRVVVLERLAAVNLASKALGIGPLGGEALQRRGMAESMNKAEARSFASMQSFAAQNSAGRRPGKFSGHFGGLSLIRKDAQREPQRTSRLVDQQTVEAMLGERTAALGIEIHRECEVTHFIDTTNGVEVEWVSPEGKGRMRCAYLVGCDGGRSTVRKMAGFEFPGTDPSLTMYTAVVSIDNPEQLMPVGWHRTSGGVFSFGAFPGRLFMLDFSGPPENREAPVTRNEIESVLRRVSGKDIRVSALESGSRWTDNTRLVNTYRKGRVLLAGDAAHIHSPFGGQGLSLGLVDAANLGWKLAAVIRGDMPDSLLDTYTAERRPVAEAVLANTLAQTAIMRPDPQAGAMRDIFASLMQFDDVNRMIGEMMTGLGVKYDLESARDDVGRLIGDRQIGDADSLYDLMQDGRAVFIDASSNGAGTRLITDRARPIRCRCVKVGEGDSMLIRPDACVAWAAEGDSVDGLDAALDRWFAASNC